MSVPEADAAERLSSRELVVGLRRFVPTIAAVTLVATIAAVLASFLLPARYTSSGSVVLAATAPTAAADVNMATEKQVASSTAVAADAIRRLDLDEPAEEVLRGLSVTVPVDADVLVFSYTSTTASDARRRVQAFIDSYLEYRRQLLSQATIASDQAIEDRIDLLRAELEKLQDRSKSDPSADLDASIDSILSQINIQEQKLAAGAGSVGILGHQLAAASLPIAPSSPRSLVNAIIGLVAGLALGTLIALARAAFPRKLHSAWDAERAVGAPVLAVIPGARRSRAEPPLIIADREAPALDAYRRLVTQVLTSPTGDRPGAGVRSIAVVGLDRDAPTAIAVANMGATITPFGHLVLLTCAADEAGPQRVYCAPDHPGLRDVIRGEIAVAEAARATSIDSLVILPAGSDDHGWPLLDALAVRRAVDELVSWADVVIVDVPARAVGEAGALVAACDAVVLVGSLHATSTGDARRTRDDLTILDQQRIGVVLFERRPRDRFGWRTEPLASDRSDWSASVSMIDAAARSPEVPNWRPRKTIHAR